MAAIPAPPVSRPFGAQRQRRGEKYKTGVFNVNAATFIAASFGGGYNAEHMKICSNLTLLPDQLLRLEQKLPHHTIQLCDGAGFPPKPVNCDYMLAADIAWGQLNVDDLREAKNLKLVQLTSAGYTRYDIPAVKELLTQRGIALCNASSIHSEPCAQHVLALLLSLTNGLPRALVQQQRNTWDKPAFAGLRLVKHLKIVLVGYGAIARRLAELLAPFGAAVVAVRRHPKGNENCPTHGLEKLPQLLGEADVVVNLLPLSSQTEGFFSAKLLAALKRRAIFINIGRGATVDQDALIAALNSEHLSQAYLDVTDPEPLPADHPLWATPNLFLTPHIAGWYDRLQPDLVTFLAENVARFDAGQPLIDRIF